jgi:hypothetical protein
MPDAMCLPDLLVLLFSLVADFAGPREEAARPENELADERSAFSPHQSCRDLLRAWLLRPPPARVPHGRVAAALLHRVSF